MSTDHPCVVTLDSRSKPRVLFKGDQLVEVDLPVGTRVIYSKKPMAGLADPDAAVRYALNNPLDSAPLYAKLKPGMRVTIAVDDLSMPLPPMKRPDPRQRCIEPIIELLDQHGVDDVEIIIATAFHRPMTEAEIRHTIGDKTVNRYWPDRLYNHDAEKPDGLTFMGTTSDGIEVEINARAASSDLVIYLNLTFVSMNGGHKSLGTGLVGYRTLRGHHNPASIRATGSYMEPARSALSEKMIRVGELIESKLDVFHVETTVNNKMFDSPLDFLAKNEDELTQAEENGLKALVKTLQWLPQPARQAIFERVPAPYALIGVFAGACVPVHDAILELVYKQHCVPVKGQSDIVILPIPYTSPYNVGAYLNPLLVSVMAEGYLHNLHRGAPLLKKGGTYIILHPLSDKFDREQHPAYVEFFHKLLPRTRDAMELHKRFERDYARHPAYIQMYRTGKAYHPAHPFYMWYWGENGRQHRGRVIVVAPDNEYVPKILGYETATTMAEALRMARETAPEDPSITCFRVCPVLMADVTPDPPAKELPDTGGAPAEVPEEAPATETVQTAGSEA
jgi:lactate racemase